MNQMSKHSKEQVKVNVLSSGPVGKFDFEIDPALTVNIIPFAPGNNYGAKVEHMCADDADHVIKIDEDCFLGGWAWDTWIEQIPQVLEDEQNILVAPIMGNGTPHGDPFIYEFFQGDALNHILDLILSYDHNKINQADLYTNKVYDLNKHTIDATEWDYEAYKSDVSKLDTVYKGLHPLRFNSQCQIFTLEYIIDNIERFLGKTSVKVETYEAPYFTSGIYAMTMSHLRQLSSLRKDPSYFDEVELNTHRNNNNLLIKLIHGCYGTHTMYNDVKINSEELLTAESKLYAKLYDAIRGYYDTAI